MTVFFVFSLITKPSHCTVLTVFQSIEHASIDSDNTTTILDFSFMKDRKDRVKQDEHLIKTVKHY